ncbi:MAG: hypothetical protein V1743_05035 [Nanoarchaeota archaeon]
MSKRGSSPLFAVFETVIVFFLVFGIFFAIVYAVGNPTKRNQAFLAKDSALMVDTLYSLPKQSQADITYPNFFEQYVFEANNNLVQVYSPGTRTGSLTPHYPYSQHRDYASFNELFLFLNLNFFKDTTAVYMHKTTQYVAEPVDDIDTAGNLAEQKILIQASPEANAIGEYLKQALRIEGVQEPGPADANALTISITYGALNEDKVNLYYSDKDEIIMRKSKKLAQILANKFTLNFNTIYAESQSIIKAPSHEGEFAVFEKNSPAVLIELGGKSKGALSVQQRIADTIMVSIQDYYKQ